MSEKRVKLNQIVKNQVPSYVRDDFPLVGEFLSQYYLGQEYQGGPLDLINNIDSYIKVSENSNQENQHQPQKMQELQLQRFLYQTQMDFLIIMG